MLTLTPANGCCPVNDCPYGLFTRGGKLYFKNYKSNCFDCATGHRVEFGHTPQITVYPVAIADV